MKVYVRGKSKREINEALARGALVVGRCFGIDGERDVLLSTLQAGDVVARFTKYAGGSPVAEGWHEWNAKKGCLR